MLPPPYAGKILRINLSTGKITTKDLPEELTKKYIGGKGVANRLLYDMVKPRIDPLGPDNKLIFATGPATGTILPNKGFIVVFKSPLSNVYGQSSCGGGWGAELKYAGYDFLVIEGRSEKPVYLWINDDTIQIKDANHLWGKNTFEAFDLIKKDLNDDKVKVARIGQAGEKLVKIASIMCGYSRSAARCGPGAVMGSKNLKAIAVRGSKDVEVADINSLLEFIKEEIKDNYELFEQRRLAGTLGIIMFMNDEGALPTKYYHKTVFDALSSKPYWESYLKIREKIVTKDKGCFSCIQHCGKLSEVKNGPYAGTIVEGPEYETMATLGALCENPDLEAIAKANQLCDKFGIDTIDAGNLIAFAMDCYEHGTITIKDTEGIDLSFGNHEAVIQLVKKIAMRTGLGNILAEGVKNAAERIGHGAEKIAVHVKGLGFPGYDPRGIIWRALGYAVADRGGDHCAVQVTQPSEGCDYEWEAAAVYDGINFRACVNTFIFCHLAIRSLYWGWKALARIFPFLMGYKIDEDELKIIGERIVMLARAFNVREGINRKDDTLPERFFKEPIRSGPKKGVFLNKNGFNKMLDEYYKLIGWNKRGIPTKKRLEKVGLIDLHKEIEPN